MQFKPCTRILLSDPMKLRWRMHPWSTLDIPKDVFNVPSIAVTGNHVRRRPVISIGKQNGFARMGLSPSMVGPMIDGIDHGAPSGVCRTAV